MVVDGGSSGFTSRGVNYETKVKMEAMDLNLSHLGVPKIGRWVVFIPDLFTLVEIF